MAHYAELAVFQVDFEIRLDQPGLTKLPMMRAISSSSRSTTGLATLIVVMAVTLDHETRAQDLGRSGASASKP